MIMEEGAIKKLLKVIDSIKKIEQIDTFRNYINQYYKLYGTNNKNLIEIYFRTRTEKIM